jgi:hypothetical protein
MAVTVADANTYFETNVLHCAEWGESDDATKQRALNNAANQLYRLYRTYNPATKPVPDVAIFEQALWLLRVDDSIMKAQYGVKSVTVAGIGVAVEDIGRYVCPEARMILGRRVGRYIR